MTLKKLRDISLISLMLMLSLTITLFAKTSYLVKISNKTYVSSYHPDDFFADQYYGTVSVLGTDRFYEARHLSYPTYTKITYDVQGKITSCEVKSTGKNDTKVRTDKITVKDKWNLGSKTKVYGNYGYRFASNQIIDPYDHK